MRAVVQLAIHHELEAELAAPVNRSHQELVIESIGYPLPEELEGRGGKESLEVRNTEARGEGAIAFGHDGLAVGFGRR